MGMKECRAVIMSLPFDKEFIASEISDDVNVHGFLARLCEEGFILRMPDKVRANGRLKSKYRRVVKGDVIDPFEPWKDVWPEFFMMPKIQGVKHRYVQVE